MNQLLVSSQFYFKFEHPYYVISLIWAIQYYSKSNGLGTTALSLITSYHEKIKSPHLTAGTIMKLKT